MKGYVALVDVAKRAGDVSARKKNDAQYFRRAVEKHFPRLVQKVKFPGRVGANFIWAIPKEKEQEVIEKLGYGGRLPEQLNPPKEHQDWEQKCANELESNNWKAIVTKRAGTPDVIAFRKRESGGFDLCIREAKGPEDKLSKEQYELLEWLKSEGVDASVRWFQAANDPIVERNS